MLNRLKGTLQNGKTYCVKFYVNISDNSSYGIDGFGAYFGTDAIDTISKCLIPLTYLIPQVQNPSGNIITDTMNWTLVTGTFVANGTEKHVIIGNFKSDAATNKTFINPINSPNVYCNVLVDDVSCIDIDLPAWAGPDMAFIPGSTVYIGRPQDVGIDEACTWYNITNTTTPIGMGAGITVTPAATATYIVKQDICGNIKRDTVVVYQSGVGLKELRIENEDFRVSPNPANELLIVNFSMDRLENEYTMAKIQNSIGQVVMVLDLGFVNKETTIPVKDLPAGCYSISFKGSSFTISRRFLVER